MTNIKGFELQIEISHGGKTKKAALWAASIHISSAYLQAIPAFCSKFLDL
jgi:hypothetical protein